MVQHVSKIRLRRKDNLTGQGLIHFLLLLTLISRRVSEFLEQNGRAFFAYLLTFNP